MNTTLPPSGTPKAPPKKRARHPIIAFGPELLAALVKGSRERVELDLPYAMGVRMQQRIHMLRAQMRNEGHELWPIVARVRTTLLWGRKAGLPDVEEVVTSRKVCYPRDRDVPCKLVLQPQDAEFAAIVKAAGINIADAPSLPGGASPPEPLTSDVNHKTLEEILASIHNEGDGKGPR